VHPWLHPAITQLAINQCVAAIYYAIITEGRPTTNNCLMACAVICHATAGSAASDGDPHLPNKRLADVPSTCIPVELPDNIDSCSARTRDWPYNRQDMHTSKISLVVT